MAQFQYQCLHRHNGIVETVVQTITKIDEFLQFGERAEFVAHGQIFVAVFKAAGIEFQCAFVHEFGHRWHADLSQLATVQVAHRIQLDEFQVETFVGFVCAPAAAETMIDLQAQQFGMEIAGAIA